MRRDQVTERVMGFISGRAEFEMLRDLQLEPGRRQAEVWV